MATRVSISKALEARLRGCTSSEEAENILVDVIALVDEEKKKAERKRAADSTEPKSGYKELVALFRSFLGSDLITPPKPSTVYIIKLLNKAREQGIDSTNVGQIAEGARRDGKPPYRLGDLVWGADRYYALGGESEGGKEERTLYTGRNDLCFVSDGEE